MENNKPDAIITSYNRRSLLELTLSSLIAHTGDFFNIHVYDDYGMSRMTTKDLSEWDAMRKKFPSVNFSFGAQRVGQVIALDTLMKNVKSEFYLKLEDDWLCTNGEFWINSVSMMREHSKMVCLWLRGIEPKAVNHHPIIFDEGIMKFEREYSWRGFSWGASVHRLSDYHMIGQYQEWTKFIPTKPWESEKKIGEIYYQKGFFASTLSAMYFKHIGDKHGIRK